MDRTNGLLADNNLFQESLTLWKLLQLVSLKHKDTDNLKENDYDHDHDNDVHYCDESCEIL